MKMNWSELFTAPNLIALCAMVYTVRGVKQSQVLAKRNEDKILIDSLLTTLNEMDSLAAHFFLSDRRERLDVHYYSTCFLTKLQVAVHITKTLQEKRKVLKESIYQPFSFFHWFSTVDIESINSKPADQNALQYSEANKAYLSCIKEIYDSSENKYIN